MIPKLLAPGDDFSAAALLEEGISPAGVDAYTGDLYAGNVQASIFAPLSLSDISLDVDDSLNNVLAYNSTASHST